MVQSQARDSLQLLDWIMSRRVHEYLDVAGRPVGEGRAAAFEQVQTEMRTCPYPGSRYHHSKPMNVTALQQMPDWQHVLTMLSWLSQRYRAARQTEITSYNDLAQVTSAGVFLVDFLVLRRHRPLRSGEIPVLISGLYKACLGLQLAYLPERFADERASAQLPDAAGFYAYLEESELLIGETEVCAGTPAMILQAYEAIIGRNTVAQEELPPPCANLEIDWDRFDLFAFHAAELWHDLILYVIHSQEICPKLVDSRLPSDVRDRLNALLERRATELRKGQSGLVVDVARVVLEFAENSRAVGLCEPSEPLAAPTLSQRGSLAAIVLEWLSGVTRLDLRTYGPLVAGELQAQLAPYDAYEERVLNGLDQHMSRLLQALEFGEPGTRLTASALSHVCGRSLRDWCASA